MEKIEVGPEARKLLMRLFMMSYLNSPEPLTGEEVEALCLLTGLQILGVRDQTPAFKEEVLDTMRAAAKRTGSPVLGATVEGLGVTMEGLPEDH